jgi:hypothetical protein
VHDNLGKFPISSASPIQILAHKIDRGSSSKTSALVLVLQVLLDQVTVLDPVLDLRIRHRHSEDAHCFVDAQGSGSFGIVMEVEVGIACYFVLSHQLHHLKINDGRERELTVGSMLGSHIGVIELWWWSLTLTWTWVMRMIHMMLSMTIQSWPLALSWTWTRTRCSVRYACVWVIHELWRGHG